MTEDVIITPVSISNESWSETPPEQKEAGSETNEKKDEGTAENNQQQQAAAQQQETIIKDDVFDENTYVKNNFGFDNVEVAKKEIEELKNKAKGFELANEDGKKAFEYLRDGKEEDLYNLLHSKKTIQKLIASDVTDPKIAADLVKLSMLNENKDKGLTEEDVEYLFNQKYSIPPKPVQEDTELEEEYNQRVSQWDAKVKDIQRGLSIEAKLAKPKLEQYNTQLVLPDIQKESNQGSTINSQEELRKIEKLREGYLAALVAGL